MKFWCHNCWPGSPLGSDTHARACLAFDVIKKRLSDTINRIITNCPITLMRCYSSLAWCGQTKQKQKRSTGELSRTGTRRSSTECRSKYQKKRKVHVSKSKLCLSIIYNWPSNSGYVFTSHTPDGPAHNVHVLHKGGGVARSEATYAVITTIRGRPGHLCESPPLTSYKLK